MNVQTLEISQEEAREKLRAYRNRRHRDAEVEYRTAERLYERAAAGDRLIVAGEAINSGGRDSLNRPNVAIARADRKQVCLFIDGRNLKFDSRSRPERYSANNLQLIHEYRGTPLVNAKENYTKWYATVPMVPADVRPATGQLRNGIFSGKSTSGSRLQLSTHRMTRFC